MLKLLTQRCFHFANQSFKIEERRIRKSFMLMEDISFGTFQNKIKKENYMLGVVA